MSKLKKGSYLSRIVSQKDKLKWKYKILKQENKHLLELQKVMDKQYEELEKENLELRKLLYERGK